MDPGAGLSETTIFSPEPAALLSPPPPPLLLLLLCGGFKNADILSLFKGEKGEKINTEPSQIENENRQRDEKHKQNIGNPFNC
jgi:hypothetical protein